MSCNKRVSRSKYIELWTEAIDELGRLGWNLKDVEDRVRLVELKGELMELMIKASEEVKDYD